MNILIAAADGQKVILISGRKPNATTQCRNKRLARVSAKHSNDEKYSSRRKRLQRRKYRMLDKSKRQVRDICHKATAWVARELPGALC